MLLFSNETKDLKTSKSMYINLYTSERSNSILHDTKRKMEQLGECIVCVYLLLLWELVLKCFPKHCRFSLNQFLAVSVLVSMGMFFGVMAATFISTDNAFSKEAWYANVTTSVFLYTCVDFPCFVGLLLLWKNDKHLFYRVYRVVWWTQLVLFVWMIETLIASFVIRDVGSTPVGLGFCFAQSVLFVVWLALDPFDTRNETVNGEIYQIQTQIENQSATSMFKVGP